MVQKKIHNYMVVGASAVVGIQWKLTFSKGINI